MKSTRRNCAAGSGLATALSDRGFVDPYIDPATGILRNRVGARTQQQLDDAEFDLVHAAGVELAESPPVLTFDLAQWKSIHRRLFEDVYEWAGEVRTVNIAKQSSDVRFDFIEVNFLDTAAAWTENEVRAAFEGAGPLSAHEFIRRLAEQYSNLNVLHPFREGNGRTQRFFWGQVAERFGFELDWRSVDAEQNAYASAIAAARLDYGPLREMFDSVVAPAGTDDPAVSRFFDFHIPSPSTRVVGGSSDRDLEPGVCGHFMPRAKKLCVLTSGHRGHHRSRRTQRS